MLGLSFKRSFVVSLLVVLAVLSFAATVDAASVAPSKPVFAAGEPIVIQFADFPGYTSDWINIVPVGAPATAWGDWKYTQGAQKGFMNFAGQRPGDYEVRGYFNYSGTGSYEIRTSYRFSVR